MTNPRQPSRRPPVRADDSPTEVTGVLGPARLAGTAMCIFGGVGLAHWSALTFSCFPYVNDASSCRASFGTWRIFC